MRAEQKTKSELWLGPFQLCVGQAMKNTRTTNNATTHDLDNHIKSSVCKNKRICKNEVEGNKRQTKHALQSYEGSWEYLM
jgi:hypothetical protein